MITLDNKNEAFQNHKIIHAELDDILQTNVSDVEVDEVFTIENAISMTSRKKVFTKQSSMLTVRDERNETTGERMEIIK